MFNRIVIVVVFVTVTLSAQSQWTPGLKPFIAVDAAVIALEHARVIDGTGAAPREDQTIVIDNGRIQAVGRDGQAQVPAAARRIDCTSRTVMPGLVGMHEHLFYPSFGGVPIYIEHGMSFPRLYLRQGLRPRVRPGPWSRTRI